jgi:hypothetical protein
MVLTFVQVAGGNSDGSAGHVSGVACPEPEYRRSVVVGNVRGVRDLVCVFVDFGSAPEAVPYQPHDGPERPEGKVRDAPS